MVWARSVIARILTGNLDRVSATVDEQLEAASWDLEPLVDGGGPEAVEALLSEARDRAEAFAGTYRGRVTELDAAELAEAMRELAAIHDLAGRAGSYVMLSFSLDTTDPARGARLQKAQELGAAIETQLLFFDLAWNDVPDERVDELLADPELGFAAHHLRNLRRYRPHQLSEPEERVLTETNVTGGSAFQRLFTEQTSALEVPLPGRDEPASLEEGLSLLQDSDRDRRREAAGAVTAALRPGLRTRAFVFNTLLQDKATKDRLRGYPHWLASRNLANEASDESVEALIAAVQGRYDLARRWYSLKARLLGLDRLASYDRMAPVSDSDDRIPYGEAEEIVLDCYRTFSPELGATAEEFFTGSYMDGPPRPGKRGGAFCSYTVPSAHPYVMLNYTSRPHDVLTMAHELGHGVHAALARPQGIFHFTTPLTLAETASIFGENIVLERLLERAPGPAERLDLLAGALDGAVAAVFRQIAMNRFEHAIHTDRRDRGELSVERFSELWLATQSDLLGDSVELDDDYGTWWSYIWHFVDAPGYVYAYAYGNLLALSVYRQVRGGGRGLRGVLPRPAPRRRLAAARGARGDRGSGPLGPRLLELGARADRAPARRRRGRCSRGGAARCDRRADRAAGRGGRADAAARTPRR